MRTSYYLVHGIWIHHADYGYIYCFVLLMGGYQVCIRCPPNTKLGDTVPPPCWQISLGFWSVGSFVSFGYSTLWHLVLLSPIWTIHYTPKQKTLQIVYRQHNPATAFLNSCVSVSMTTCSRQEQQQHVYVIHILMPYACLPLCQMQYSGLLYVRRLHTVHQIKLLVWTRRENCVKSIALQSDLNALSTLAADSWYMYYRSTIGATSTKCPWEAWHTR